MFAFFRGVVEVEFALVCVFISMATWMVVRVCAGHLLGGTRCTRVDFTVFCSYVDDVQHWGTSVIREEGNRYGSCFCRRNIDG